MAFFRALTAEAGLVEQLQRDGDQEQVLVGQSSLQVRRHGEGDQQRTSYIG